MPRVLLCIDMSYQVYRAAAAHPNLESRGVFTGGLYGFLATFGKMVRETRATHVAFCQDVKPYRRSLEYPEYKQLRKKAADNALLEMYKESMALVLDVLDVLGIELWGIPGFESDDLIAHCARKYRHRFDAIYAGSNDSDLFQWLWVPNFAIYSDSIKTVMTGERLLKEHGLTPDQYMLMTAITGTHNDIAGIYGIGPDKAKKAMADPVRMRALREKDNAAAIIDRNLGLIRLPHPEFPADAALPDNHARFNPRTLYRALSMYDIDSMPGVEQAFEQFCGDRR
jgi:5'-3' exonuclease